MSLNVVVDTIVNVFGWKFLLVLGAARMLNDFQLALLSTSLPFIGCFNVQVTPCCSVQCSNRYCTSLIGTSSKPNCFRTVLTQCCHSRQKSDLSKLSHSLGWWPHLVSPTLSMGLSKVHIAFP